MQSAFMVSLAVIAGLSAFGFAVATKIVSDRFFERLIARHPELSEAFPPPMIGTRYGPILPSKVKYLEAKRFRDLPESDLRELGSLSRKLLMASAATFVAFVVLLVGWKTFQQIS